MWARVLKKYDRDTFYPGHEASDLAGWRKKRMHGEFLHEQLERLAVESRGLLPAARPWTKNAWEKVKELDVLPEELESMRESRKDPVSRLFLP